MRNEENLHNSLKINNLPPPTSPIPPVDNTLLSNTYNQNDKTLFYVYHKKANEAKLHRDVRQNFLVFVLKGEIKFITISGEEARIHEGTFFLVSAGYSYFSQALTDATAITCMLNHSMSLYNEYSLTRLYEEIEKYKVEQSIPDPFCLPIHDLMKQELLSCAEVIQKNQLCFYYQQSKFDILLLMLWFLYPKEDLYKLFQPVLGEDFTFKSQVLKLYQQVKNVKELMNGMNMPPTSFNRKFQAVFHTTAGKWMIEKKERDLLNELRMSSIPFKELAEKYEYSPNYLIQFCKTHFGKSPSELRDSKPDF